MMTQKRKRVIILDLQNNPRVGFPKPWIVTGYTLLVAAAFFVGRIVYEETILTWTNGPQMVGFAMMHGAAPVFLFSGLIGIPGGLLWAIVTLVWLFKKKFRIPPADWAPIISLIILAALLFIPYESWEELAVRVAGPGAHGSDFMVQAAAQGKRRFRRHLVRKGYDVNSKDKGHMAQL